MRFQVLVSLKLEDETEVWRRIMVPLSYNFYQFHLLIQAAFGWENRHLHQFSEKDARLFIISGPDEEYIISSREIGVEGVLMEMYKYALMSNLRADLKNNSPLLLYTYDFGDKWEHTIIVEEFFPRG